MTAEEFRKQLDGIFDGEYNLPEGVRLQLPPDKLFRHYAEEDQYQKIKQMGDYTETHCRGVTILTDHSCEKLEKFIIIKVPRWER